MAPIFIQDAAVQAATIEACGDGVDAPVAPACLAPNTDAAPICAAMADNSIYQGAYDMVSAYQASSLGAINTTCFPEQAWGLYADCMAAACILGGPGGEPTAWDGSPVTCFCSITNGTAGEYQASPLWAGAVSRQAGRCVNVQRTRIPSCTHIPRRWAPHTLPLKTTSASRSFPSCSAASR